MRSPPPRTILCILHAQSNQQALLATLRTAHYAPLSSATAEHAVAFCMNNPVSAVVMDAKYLPEHGWSVAQTLKGVCPNLPILLFIEDKEIVAIPQSVDAIVHTSATMLSELERLIEGPATDQAAMSS